MVRGSACILLLCIVLAGCQDLSILQSTNVSFYATFETDQTHLYAVISASSEVLKLDFELNVVASGVVTGAFFTPLNLTTGIGLNTFGDMFSPSGFILSFYDLNTLTKLETTITVNTTIPLYESLYFIPQYSNSSILLLVAGGFIFPSSYGFIEVDFTSGEILNKILLPFNVTVSVPIPSLLSIGFGLDSGILSYFYLFDLPTWSIAKSANFTAGFGLINPVVAQVTEKDSTLAFFSSQSLVFLSLSSLTIVTQTPVEAGYEILFLASDHQGNVYLAGSNLYYLPVNITNTQCLVFKCVFGGQQIDGTTSVLLENVWVGMGMPLSTLGVVHEGDLYSINVVNPLPLNGSVSTFQVVRIGESDE